MVCLFMENNYFCNKGKFPAEYRFKQKKTHI